MGIQTNGTNRMSNCAQIIALNTTKYSEQCRYSTLLYHPEINCIQLSQYPAHILTASMLLSVFLSTDYRATDRKVLHLRLFSHLSSDCSPPECRSLGENFRLYSHLQHFLKVPIQIPTRIISSLHSDVLPFILALYYCQLSLVLGKRRKRISSAFLLLGHFTEVVSPYRLGAPQILLNVTPPAPQDTIATCLLSCHFQLWVHLNDLRTINKFLYNISNWKTTCSTSEVQWQTSSKAHCISVLHQCKYHGASCSLRCNKNGYWSRMSLKTVFLCLA